jgi:hypothetical protein
VQEATFHGVGEPFLVGESVGMNVESGAKAEPGPWDDDEELSVVGLVPSSADFLTSLVAGDLKSNCAMRAAVPASPVDEQFQTALASCSLSPPCTTEPIALVAVPPCAVCSSFSE